MSQSCSNTYAIAHMMRVSGMVSGMWEAVLVDSTYQVHCDKLVTKQHIHPDCIIGCMDFAVSLNEKQACVEIAQTEIRFPSVANRYKDIHSMILLSSTGMGVAVIGRDLLMNMFRGHDTGADLVLRSGADRSIFGL